MCSEKVNKIQARWFTYNSPCLTDLGVQGWALFPYWHFCFYHLLVKKAREQWQRFWPHGIRDWKPQKGLLLLYYTHTSNPCSFCFFSFYPHTPSPLDCLMTSQMQPEGFEGATAPHREEWNVDTCALLIQGRIKNGHPTPWANALTSGLRGPFSRQLLMITCLFTEQSIWQVMCNEDEIRVRGQ